jgi:hypothetical protein
MAISALKASQLATLLAGHAKMFTANNPGQNEFADYLLRSGQSATMGLLAEEEEKKRKKAEKGGLFGKIGSTLGTAAGIALAPVTGGASLALAGAAGGALGGLAGQYAAGGSPTLMGTALDAAQGGLSGYNYGKAGELANSIQTSGVQPDIPASPDIAAKMGTAQANALPSIMTTSPGATANVPAAASALTPNPGMGRYAVDPVAKNLAMVKRPGQLGVPAAAQRTRPSFFGALNHVMNPQPQRPAGRLMYTTPSGVEIYG